MLGHNRPICLLTYPNNYHGYQHRQLVVYFDYDYAGQIEAGTWEKIEPAIETFKNGLSFEERHPLVQKALSTYFVKDMIERWAYDIVDVVNKLDEWNNADFFKDRLDVSNVGVLGHSRGGGAADWR